MSGRLVKVIDDDLIIAHTRIAAPGYTIYVSDATSAHGWSYYAENVEHEDFAVPWKAASGAHDAYPVAAVVTHNGQEWYSIVANNVWEPGVSGWIPLSDSVPIWVQPSGAHDTYPINFVAQHAGKYWRSLTEANVWEPGVANWRETALPLPDGTPAIPDWVQPTGAQDAYGLDDVVKHVGKTWKSTQAVNVWEPGVFGWVEVT